MKYGHTTGTKTGTRKSQSWYDEIAEARIAEMEAQQEIAKLAEVVGNAITVMPEAAPRIARAATLVQQHDVWGLTSGSYLVGSASDAQAAHLVHRQPAWHCDCADHTYRKRLCVHILSVMLTVKMGAAYQPVYDLPQAA